ncbi:hypothetical protein ACL7TT_16345 [Microbulbifer sp. 2304DJ12-6]|uniref:hypothetical protein n=1 Tax=Microbulbifer sp. 2304DJ12-6 TaxID=3233340 RepID=UPI0039B08DEA
MFDLMSSKNTLFKVHRLRLQRGSSGTVHIEVREVIQADSLTSIPKFTACVTDGLGIPNKNFIFSGDSFEEAVNKLLPQAQSLPLDVLRPSVEKAADMLEAAGLLH